MPTLWPFEPAGAVTERLEWKTDVLESDGGPEQAIALRAYPRRFFEHDIVLDGRDARTAENLIHGNGSGEWYLPVWMDGEPLMVQASSGSGSVPADTDTRDYTADNYVALISRTNPHASEVHQVDTVGPTTVTLAGTLAATWPAGSILAPLRTARLVSGAAAFARFTGGSIYGRLRWQCTDLTDYTAATETTYRGYPVMTHRTNWDADPSREYARRQAVVDSGNGVPRIFDFWGGPKAIQDHRWLCDGRSEIDALRQWIFARRGRYTALWMPSWARDLDLQQAIGSGATTIDVEHCGYTDHIAQAIGRRDIRILLTDGTTYYRRINGSAEIDADTERLTISSALGASITPAAVAAISFMHLARLDADAVEIAWHRWDVAASVFALRGIRNDL